VGTLVLAGQADPGTVGRPMELFLDAIEGVDGSDDPDTLAVVSDRARPAEERVRAALDIVARVTRGVNGVVVFEDLHWADSESLTVFERLAEPDRGRLLLVGTYRPDALSRRHPASELLPRLERRHSVTHIHLSRLTPPDVSVLLGAVYREIPSFRVVEELHTRTGGNPFFLEELIATSGDRWDHLDSMPLPWTVAELVRAQVDELQPDERRIVATASVLGRRVSFDVLASVTNTSEAELIELLRSVVDRGLMVEIDPDVFGFHHEIAREAVESGLLGRERRRLHEAALEALREMGSSDHVALARHARGAGRYDDMVEEARLGAHESLAVGSTYQALQLAELGLGEAETDRDLLGTAARAAWMAGVHDDAEHYAERWLQLARENDDVRDEAAALGLRMRVAYDTGDTKAMADRTDDLIQVIDLLPTDEVRARAMAFVAQSYMLRDDPDSTSEWADKAIALADAHGLVDVRAAALVEKGSALLQLPNSDEGRAILEDAIDEAERIGDHVLAARALNNLVWHARKWMDFDQVRARIERMREHADAAGFESLGAGAEAEALAHLASLEGDLDAAIDFLDQSRQSVRGYGGWTRGLAVFRAGLALEAGDIDGAEEFTEECKPATERTALALAGLDFHIACRRGRLAEARTHLATVLAQAAKEDYMPADQVHDLLAAGLNAGLPIDELRPLLEDAGSRGHRLVPEDDWSRMLEAQVAEAEGRTEDAVAAYQAAAAGLVLSKKVLAGRRGTAHVGAARGLIALGRLDEARAHAEAAATDLARWRGWRVDELTAVQRRLGVGPEPAGPESLTPREREVAALVAEGLSNAQVAERLYISPRTAAVHVSNILAKLGMSSRTEIAAWAVRDGLTTQT
jgi:DNA-binding NarL/FixJ family response regulator